MSQLAPMEPAEAALSLLFKKLHPHLEDAAHALTRKVAREELEKLHLKLMKARGATVAALEASLQSDLEPDLAEALGALAANLAPNGETYRESLILTQLCLEDAPADLLPFVPEAVAAKSAWAPRMAAFLERTEDPAYQAEARWAVIDEEIGETEEEF